MSSAKPVALSRIADGPEVRLLDARGAGLDEPALRAWARELTDRARAPHSARSYRYPCALIAWHSDLVGVDLERVEPYSEAFHDSICTPSERGRIPDGAGRDAFLSSLWCSKEALGKALGDALAYDPRRLESPVFWPGGRAGRWRARALEASAGHVAWLCWRASTAWDASAQH